MSHIDEIAQRSTSTIDQYLIVLSSLFSTPAAQSVSKPMLLTLRAALTQERERIDRVLEMASQECERRKI